MLWNPSSDLHEGHASQCLVGCSQSLAECSRNTSPGRHATSLMAPIGPRTPWQPFPNLYYTAGNLGRFHSIFFPSRFTQGGICIIAWWLSQLLPTFSRRRFHWSNPCTLSSILVSASLRCWTNTHALSIVNSSLCSLLLRERPHAVLGLIRSTYSNSILWTKYSSHLLHEVCLHGPWTCPHSLRSTHFCRSSIVPCFKAVENIFNCPNIWGQGVGQTFPY